MTKGLRYWWERCWGLTWQQSNKYGRWDGDQLGSGPKNVAQCYPYLFIFGGGGGAQGGGVLYFTIGSFRVKSTSFQKSSQVTLSDFDETSSEWLDVAQMNTYKKTKSYSMSFSRYDPLKFGRGGHFVLARDAKSYFCVNFRLWKLII